MLEALRSVGSRVQLSGVAETHFFVDVYLRSLVRGGVRFPRVDLLLDAVRRHGRSGEWLPRESETVDRPESALAE